MRINLLGDGMERISYNPTLTLVMIVLERICGCLCVQASSLLGIVLLYYASHILKLHFDAERAIWMWSALYMLLRKTRRAVWVVCGRFSSLWAPPDRIHDTYSLKHIIKMMYIFVHSLYGYGYVQEIYMRIRSSFTYNIHFIVLRNFIEEATFDI